MPLSRLLSHIFGPKTVAKESPDNDIDPLDVTLDVRAKKVASLGKTLRLAKDFPTVPDNYALVGDSAYVADGADQKAFDGLESMQALQSSMQGAANPLLQQWYDSQSFIGYQACAIMAQHWLINKACSMPGEDAVRNGYDLNIVDSNGQMARKQAKRFTDKLTEYDEQFKITQQLTELDRFTNVFGIRVCIFEVESSDAKYYEKPFNIDGVAPGTYKGVKQIDPYWIFPVLTMKGQSDPSSRNFYDPEFWTVNGKRYHKSHLIVTRGPEPADFLKPAYMFGGVSIPQQIHERVYAAERTANEGPLLAMTKRTTSLHVNLPKATANQGDFTKRLLDWIGYRDNFGVKVLGKDEVMEQTDTSLADLDSVIMTQYQLVAAAAQVPATKLMGTSPKGFNATGEFEMISYHERLESIQTVRYVPFLQRHYLLLIKSEFEDSFSVEVMFHPVDVVSAKEQAEINKTKMDTDKLAIDSGAISPDESRQRLRGDRNSGYDLSDDDEGDSVQNEFTALPEVAKFLGLSEEGVNEFKELPFVREFLNSTPEVRSEKANSFLMLPGVREFLACSPSNSFAALPEVKKFLNDSIYAPGSKPKLPKVRVHGFNIEIETPRGFVRAGVDLDGTEWRVLLPHHYGYIKGVLGADGDELDAFVGPAVASRLVTVINQHTRPNGEFDEHKVMFGFNSRKEAIDAYNASYSEGWDGMESAHTMKIDEFEAWMASADLTKPCEGV